MQDDDWTLEGIEAESRTSRLEEAAGGHAISFDPFASASLVHGTVSAVGSTYDLFASASLLPAIRHAVRITH